MCGICGFTGPPDRGLIERMTRTLAHRGPDGEGVEILDGCSLGHRRLAVIDLSDAGREPMPNEDATVWLTMNGEVYNFQALREELERRGHRFRSRTDAECVVHLYEDMGERCVEKLEGMFAFAVWDARGKSLFVARDRLGERPLYYSLSGDGRVAFGSEMKALLALPWVSREVDLAALDEYLSYLYVPAPRTIYRDIRELPPAHAAVLRDGSLRAWRYWEPPREPARERVAPEEIAELLERSVRSMMVSDVPLGAFLSGGVDSSTIVAFMARASARPVRTFTVVFGEEGELYDERERARRVARLLGTEHAEIPAHADAAGLLEPMVRGFDEPFGNPTALLTYVMARETKRHVTVALAGDGGDEVFGGYPRYQGLLALRRLSRLPMPVRHALSAMSGLVPESVRGRHWLRRVREFLSAAGFGPRDAYASWVGYFSPRQKARLYAGPLRDRLSRPPDMLERLFDEGAPLGPVGRAQRCDLMSFLPFNCLRYGDRMASAHGLELRLPMLERRLVERSLAAPDRGRVSWREQKILLRRAMRGLVPDDVLDGPKIGFNPPMGVWLNRELWGLVEDRLSEGALRRRGLFRPEFVRGLVEAHRRGLRDYTWHVWSLVVLEEWFRIYQD